MLVLHLAIGYRSLLDHGEALTQSDLLEVRRRVARFVSSEIACMAPEEVARAATESVLENGNDAVFGAPFWFVLASAPGVVRYCFENTLDVTARTGLPMDLLIDGGSRAKLSGCEKSRSGCV